MTMREQTMRLLAHQLTEAEIDAMVNEVCAHYKPDEKGECRCLLCGEKEWLVDAQNNEVAWEDWRNAVEHKEAHRRGCLYPILRELTFACCNCGCGMLHHTLIRAYGDDWQKAHEHIRGVKQLIYEIRQNTYYNRNAIERMEKEGPLNSFNGRDRANLEQELYGLNVQYRQPDTQLTREDIASMGTSLLLRELYPLVLRYHRERVEKADAEIAELRKQIPMKNAVIAELRQQSSLKSGGK